MKSKLKIQFTDFWGGFNPEKNFFTELLQIYYDIEISNEPDLLFYSVYDFNHIRFTCPKIFYTGENVRPNFRECDFAISFDYEDYGGRNLRVPLYKLYWWAPKLAELTGVKDVAQIAAKKTSFCCMVVSNGKAEERNRMFKLLNEYKKVDSGGLYLNNVGGPVKDKLEFIKDYKFVLSFENSSYPGYTTEKIVEPMMVNSLPVYWGNPEVGRDFNTKSFINVHEYKTMENAVEGIIRLDKNNELYLEKLAEPFFNNNQFPLELEYNTIGEKLFVAVNRLMHQQPISQKLFYKPEMMIKKFKRKLYSKIYKRPHFYF